MLSFMLRMASTASVAKSHVAGLEFHILTLGWMVGSMSSPSTRSSSNSFSPGLTPVKIMSMSSPGLKPLSVIIWRARSTILTGSPMSSRNICPPSPVAAACKTNCAASEMVMKYRVISGWVTFTGPPSAICLRKVGTTEPDEPRTLPNRTALNFVPQCGWSLSVCV